MTSSRQGYYVPAERSPHLRTLMAWPDETATDNIADLFQAQREIAAIANTIAKYEPVRLYAKPSNCHIASNCVSENVTVAPLDVTEPWIRDTGPVIATSRDGKSQAGIDFHFNYWGNKIECGPSQTDQKVVARILSERSLEKIPTSLVLEGGAIETDGNGTLLVTRSSIINSNRNPDLSEAEIETELRHLLGVTNIIWLPGAKDLDITDTHIDGLARFGPDSRTILLSRPNEYVPHDDPAYAVYDKSHAILSAATNAAGERFRIIELEEARSVPRQLVRPKEQMTFAPEDEWEAATSYVNFYLPNGAVIVPQFGDERTDMEALEVLGRLFSERVVEGVMLDWMAWAGGGVHCATMQWPVPPVVR